MRYTETKNGKETEFIYITDLSITNKNIENSIFVGRRMWKMLNLQKSLKYAKIKIYIVKRQSKRKFMTQSQRSKSFLNSR